jgi:hypothetical protein
MVASSRAPKALWPSVAGWLARLAEADGARL